jgi:hypothetical protein
MSSALQATNGREVMRMNSSQTRLAIVVCVVSVYASWAGLQAQGRGDGFTSATNRELAAARSATARYHDVAQAEADGYVNIDLRSRARRRAVGDRSPRDRGTIADADDGSRHPAARTHHVLSLHHARVQVGREIKTVMRSDPHPSSSQRHDDGGRGRVSVDATPGRMNSQWECRGRDRSRPRPPASSSPRVGTRAARELL